ncbi:MAG TPA: hypothetical protein VJ180_11160, partial [Pyrinomonadaceae bacterium]|nr:hypothetical protein [Pyrinomonadaceae bacterium]
MHLKTQQAASVFSLFTLFVLGVAFANAQQLGAWSPQTSVAVRYVSVFPTSPGSHGVGARAELREPIVASPDGEKFFFVTRRGDLRSDSVVYELLTYRVADVRAWLARSRGRSAEPLLPWRMVSHRSTSSMKPAISDIRWDADGGSIIYWGLDDHETFQVRRLDMRSGKVE